MRYIFYVLLVGALFLCACWGLPDNFSKLSLEDKIKAYEHHLRMGGASNGEAHSYISWHGRPAAQRVIPFLQGTEDGISRRDALMIMWYVQLRGCDLRGTDAEKALSDFVKRNDLRLDERSAAEGALESIIKDNHFQPGKLDSLSGGPCEREFLDRSKGASDREKTLTPPEHPQPQSSAASESAPQRVPQNQ